MLKYLLANKCNNLINWQINKYFFNNYGCNCSSKNLVKWLIKRVLIEIIELNKTN